MDRIRLKIRWLTEKPVRGHPVHEFPESGCVEVHEGKYRIIYRITDEALSIVTVIHMKQRLDVERLQ